MFKVGDRVYVDFGDGVDGGEVFSTVTKVEGDIVTLEGLKPFNINDVPYIEKD